MISGVLALIDTLVQIIFLRRGPEALPHSTILFAVAVMLWLAAGLSAIAMIDSYVAASLFVDMILATVGLLLYGLAINAAGHNERRLRAFTAIMGCSAIFNVVLFSLQAGLPRIVSKNEALAVVQLVWLWSVPVKGHIVARAMGKPWLVGFLLAFAVLLLQLQLLSVLRPLVANE